MSRPRFATLFSIVAAGFMPVVFVYDLTYSIAPVSGVMMTLLDSGWPRRTPQMMLWSVLLVIGWLAVFWTAAFVIDGARRERLPSPYHMWFRSILLAVVFASSFAPVLTWGSLRGHGGKYNFWTAIPRYFERRAM
jgi:hypothetical protein